MVCRNGSDQVAGAAALFLVRRLAFFFFFFCPLALSLYSPLSHSLSLWCFLMMCCSNVHTENASMLQPLLWGSLDVFIYLFIYLFIYFIYFLFTFFFLFAHPQTPACIRALRAAQSEGNHNVIALYHVCFFSPLYCLYRKSAMHVDVGLACDVLWRVKGPHSRLWAHREERSQVRRGGRRKSNPWWTDEMQH